MVAVFLPSQQPQVELCHCHKLKDYEKIQELQINRTIMHGGLQINSKKFGMLFSLCLIRMWILRDYEEFRLNFVEICFSTVFL